MRSEAPAAVVEVWHAPLDLEPAVLEHLAASLDADERTRAARFHFPRDRRRFTAGRGLLRQMLARQLGERPARLRFGYTAEGKPFLADHPELGFNASHSEDRLLVGVVRGRRLGVDIERVPAADVVDAVAPRVFSGPEREALDALEGVSRRECFARLWTRKEAVIKADGRGMAMALELIDVWTSEERARFRDPVTACWSECPHWWIRSLSATPRYAAALAIEGAGPFEVLDRPWEST